MTMSMMDRSRPKAARLGRPPVGRKGEKVSDYPQVMIRLPQETKDVLEALSGLTGTPVWRLIDQAVDTYVKQLSDAERKLLASVRQRRAAGAAPKD
jgi:predicted DNA-binding protein